MSCKAYRSNYSIRFLRLLLHTFSKGKNIAKRECVVKVDVAPVLLIFFVIFKVSCGLWHVMGSPKLILSLLGIAFLSLELGQEREFEKSLRHLQVPCRMAVRVLDIQNV